MLSSAFLLLEVLVALELEVLLLPTVLELVPEPTVPDLLVVDPVLTLTSMLEVLVPVLEVLEDTDQDLLAVDLPSILTSMLEVLEVLAVLEVPEVLEVPVALELVDSCSTES